MPATVIVTLRMSGHARASGYDRLQEFLDGSLIRPPEQWSLSQRALARGLRVMTQRSGSLWYQRANLISELSAARQWLRGKGQLFHFLYGENSYRYLGLLKTPAQGNAIVCTYHTPPGRFVQVVKDRKHIERLDAVIVMSTIQVDFFAEILGADRVFFVPHGIDIDSFTPGTAARGSDRTFRCLFVGSHLRDIETLAAAAKRLQSRSNLRFTVLTRPGNLPAFSGLGNVDIHSGVDDRQLLALYQGSDVFVMPLLDSTANNSLLEAMACGMPIITTDLQGVRDYVDRECAALVAKGDVAGLCEAIVRLQEDDTLCGRMAQASRRRALDFRWEEIARRTVEVHRFASRELTAG